MRGQEVHVELIVEGDASTLAVMTIYKSGTTTEWGALAAGERLNITDLFVNSEAGADFAVIAGAAAAAGLYIAYGSVAAQGGVDKHYATPYACPVGVVPYFAGGSSNRSACIMEGFITTVGGS